MTQCGNYTLRQGAVEVAPVQMFKMRGAESCSPVQAAAPYLCEGGRGTP